MIKFFYVHQLFTAFLHEADNFFTVDLCTAISVRLEEAKRGTIMEPPEKIFQTYIEELKKRQKEGESYYALLGNLKILESLLSKRRYNLKSINKFRNRTEVTKAISELKLAFKDQLIKYSNQTGRTQ
jgi:hypothetical protein